MNWSSELSDERAADPLQREIARALGVAAAFEAEVECRRRVEFLVRYLRESGAGGYVLGISGGLDSTVAGRMAQLACDRAGGMFIALRLPYGIQADEADAEAALSFIAPHEQQVLDVKPATDAIHARATPAGGRLDAAADLVKGNIKARQRMVAQYAVAGGRGLLVLGTDHAAEAVMGFFTKFGDGAADVMPLAGLTKGRVRAIGRHLQAPEALVTKVPTADLEDHRPGIADEAVHGVSYDQIDAYLLGEAVEDTARQRIEAAYLATRHKRALPVVPR